MKTNLLKVLVMTATLFSVGCTKENSSSTSVNTNTSSSSPLSNSSLTNSVNPVGIEITSTNGVSTIKVDETLQLNAKVYPETADQSVVWSSSDDSVASVNTTGLVTGVKVGTVKIIATSTIDANVRQEFALIIEEKEEVYVAPESIAISVAGNATSLKAGENLELTAVVLPQGASQAVTWSSSDETVATVRRGTVTGLKEGSVTITATSDENENVKQSVTLTVEKGDVPGTTEDWDTMDYSSHDTFMTSEAETPLKVKGVVTHVTPTYTNDEGATLVNYYIQDGINGFYVYAQDAIAFPVTEGKSYDVGGFKKYYQGQNEIVDVQYFEELSENLTYTVTDVNNKDVTSRDEMDMYHGSYISCEAIVNSLPTNYTKAFSVNTKINGKDIDLRVDPKNMPTEDFDDIVTTIKGTVVGSKLTVKGIMSAFGYGKPSNQIAIVKAKDIEAAALTDADIVSAVKGALTIDAIVNGTTNSITLPSSVQGFDATITWASSDTTIITNDGTVTHPEKDTNVKLTATIASNDVTDTKEFSVLVYGTNSNYTEVASLDLEDALPAASYGCSETKSSYDEGTVELGTPTYTWLLRNALIGGDKSDTRNGTFSIRTQSNSDEAKTGRIEIQEDLEINAVQFNAGLYGTNPTIQVGVQYSKDNGTTWIDTNVIITITTAQLNEYRILLPETADRVAIYAVAGTGKRVNIDDIQLLK